MKDKAKFNKQEVCQLITNILDSHEVSPLKASIQALLRQVENTDHMHNWLIRNQFYEAVTERDIAYQYRTKGLKYNAIIIPSESALTALIPAYVPMEGDHYEFVDGLHRFISHLDEYVYPMYPAITERDIRATLSAAQRAFGMIDIIAPDYPLRVHRFDYSHIKYNSECGVMSGDSRQSVIFLFHPREDGICDSVFIFAHELGHALHFALTGDINILPEGFESFNNRYFPAFDTETAKQEGFADATAIAILGSMNSKLKAHFPTKFCKDISPMFVRYFEELTGV